MVEPNPAGVHSGPRIYCVPDPSSRVAVVMERRPRKWWRLGLWDLASGAYDEGAWFRGSLYPQRCDLSPGGRWFCYFAFRNDSDWPAGPTYNAVSRPPWLRALAAWREGGTWSRGFHFAPGPETGEVGVPAVGGPPPAGLPALRLTPAASFAVERRRGWRESAATPPRDPADAWDERRGVTMEKPSPDAARPAILSVSGPFEGFRVAPVYRPPAESPYRLRLGTTEGAVEGAQWADWTADGALAVATRDGALQLRDGAGRGVLREVRLPETHPQPRPAPDWAGSW